MPDPTSSMIVYGQRQAEAGSQPTLRLCVGRRRVVAPPSAKKKIRPGEPLPRGELHHYPHPSSLTPSPDNVPQSAEATATAHPAQHIARHIRVVNLRAAAGSWSAPVRVLVDVCGTRCSVRLAAGPETPTR
jgi:hypothetical protein